MNNFFINITKNLELKEHNSSNANTSEDVPRQHIHACLLNPFQDNIL